MDLAQGNSVVTALVVIQGLWGLFLIVLTWAIRRVLKDIETNTAATTRVAESVNSINLLLSGNYVTKPEFDRLETRVREAERKQTELETEARVRHRRSDESS